jgi:hypothetical protein
MKFLVSLIPCGVVGLLTGLLGWPTFGWETLIALGITSVATVCVANL